MGRTLANGLLVGPLAPQLTLAGRVAHQEVSLLTGIGRDSVRSSVCNIKSSIRNESEDRAPTVKALGLSVTPTAVSQTNSTRIAHKRIVFIARVTGGRIESSSGTVD